MKFPSLRPSSIALLLLLTAAITGCMKDAGHNAQYLPASGIAFVHTSPKNGTLDFIDYDMYSGNVLSRLNYNTYAAFPVDKNKSTPYRAFVPGMRTFGVATAGTYRFLDLKQFSFIPEKLYTVFAIDTASKTSLFVVRDSSRSIDSTKASVKFINFSPDSKKISFTLNNDPKPIVSNKAFTEASGYISLTPRDNYSVTVTEIMAKKISKTRKKISLEKGGIYTIWARGLESASDTTGLNVSILRTR